MTPIMCYSIGWLSRHATWRLEYVPSSWCDSNARADSSVSLTRRVPSATRRQEHKQGRVLIGSTRNPTSTDSTLRGLPRVVCSPRFGEFQPVDYTPYWTRSPVLLVALSASKQHACRTRDCDFFSFPMSSYSFYTSCHFRGPVESNHPNLRALSTRRSFFVLPISVGR